MQFNKSITLNLNTYNDFAEVTAASANVIKCAILTHIKGNDKRSEGESARLSMVIMVKYNAIFKYCDPLANDLYTFTYGGINYDVKSADAIATSSGKIKFYEFILEEVKKSD